jgi:hypothetical protein
MALSMTVALSSTVFADGAGTSGGGILNLGVGTRAIGMGEAFTAQADDVSSLFWNPAGIAIMNQGEASFLYSQWLKDITFQHAAVGVPMERGGIAAGVSYLSFGDIEGFDASGEHTGSVKANSGVAHLGGGMFGDWWALGSTVKAVQGTLADEKATGFAADFGATALYPNQILGGTLRGAATVRNLGTGLKFIDQRDPFPTEFRAGLALVQTLNRHLNLSLDYGKARDAKGALYGGLEYWLNSYLALRTGYAGTDAEGSGLRAGVGLKIKNISFDYAYGGYGDLGMTHRYEVAMRFGEIRPTLSPEQRAMFRRAKLALAQGRYGESVLLMDSLVQTQASYKPFQRVLRMAMKMQEDSEQLAKAKPVPQWQPDARSGPRKVMDLSGEQEELEALLKLSEDSYARRLGTEAKK